MNSVNLVLFILAIIVTIPLAALGAEPKPSGDVLLLELAAGFAGALIGPVGALFVVGPPTVGWEEGKCHPGANDVQRWTLIIGSTTGATFGVIGAAWITTTPGDPVGALLLAAVQAPVGLVLACLTYLLTYQSPPGIQSLINWSSAILLPTLSTAAGAWIGYNFGKTFRIDWKGKINLNLFALRF
ncbi:hypothetical protein HYR54_14685 [Candidatus Acetothermia bacterium]|nr:hypothetical protein [Candidatus Acetothermia bacterium]